MPPVTGGAIRLYGTTAEALTPDGGDVVVGFDFGEDFGAEAMGASNLVYSPKVGPFTYINNGMTGPTTFVLDVTLPERQELRRVGFRLWNRETPLRMTGMEFHAVRPKPPREIWVNISVDVEALPPRAPANHVDRLIYGRYGDGQEHGIGGQMAMFRAMGVPATFYVEFGTAAIHGEDTLHKVASTIRDAGFDMQLHLHSEMLVRAQRWRWLSSDRPSLDNLDLSQTRRAMGYAVERYAEVTGGPPRAFRAGGYLFNPNTVTVAKELGIQGLSNYRADQRTGNAWDFAGDWPMQPFTWTNGLSEFPITISPEPLSSLRPEEVWNRIMHHVEINGTWLVNVVIHSWSLAHRNADGHHEWRNGELQDALRRIIELAPERVRFVPITQAIDAVRHGEVKLTLTRDIATLQRRASLQASAVPE